MRFSLGLVIACLIMVLNMVAAQRIPQVQLLNFQYNTTSQILSGELFLLNIAYRKIVNINYSNAADSWNLPGQSCAAFYFTGPDPLSGIENWKFVCQIGPLGIKQFYIKYEVAGRAYIDNNGCFGCNYQAASQMVTAPMNG